MRMSMIVIVLMRMAVFVLMIVRMSVAMLMRLRIGSGILCSDYVHLGCRNSAAHNFPRLQVGADVQRQRRFCEDG